MIDLYTGNLCNQYHPTKFNRINEIKFLSHTSHISSAPESYGNSGTVSDGTAIEHFHHHRKFHWTGLLWNIFAQTTGLFLNKINVLL